MLESPPLSSGFSPGRSLVPSLLQTSGSLRMLPLDQPWDLPETPKNSQGFSPGEGRTVTMPEAGEYPLIVCR